MFYYKVTEEDGSTSYEAREMQSDIVGGVEITEQEYNVELEAFYAAMQQEDHSDEATEDDILDALADLGVI